MLILPNIDFTKLYSIADFGELRSLGTNLKPKKIEFWAFLGPSGQNQLYHTPLLFKIWDLTKNKKIVNDPFNRGH